MIMINIWEFEYAGMVRIIDIDGVEFIGEAGEITEASEQTDLAKQEDSITLYAGGSIEFYASEIKAIEKLE